MLSKIPVSPMVKDMLRRSPVPCGTCDRSIIHIAFRIFVAEKVWGIEENAMFCQMYVNNTRVVCDTVYKKYRQYHRNSVVCPICLSNMLDKQWESF